MSDSVNNKINSALEALKEELRREYESKIAELEKRAAFGDKVKEQSSFYVSWLSAQPLKAFKIVPSCDLNTRELGRLQEAFLKKFCHYYLFVQGHIELAQRGRYALWVIKGVSHMNDPNDDKLQNEDYTAMCNFIEGFTAARNTEPSIK